MQQLRNSARGMLVGALTMLAMGTGIDFAVGQSPLRQSADAIWTSAERATIEGDIANAWIRPRAYHGVTLDINRLTAALAGAELESAVAARDARAQITLPMPDGSFADFQFVEAPVMAPALAAKYPEIRTYLGQGIDDPAASVRFDFTPAGFHAQILSPRGAVYIDPLNRADVLHYASYRKRDLTPPDARPGCTLFPNPDAVPDMEIPQGAERIGETLRTYRLACAATGEYTQFHGGTVSAGLAAIVTAINRVTGVYENEVGVRLELVPNNDLIVYTNGGSDPYSNGNGSAMLSQNQSNIDSVIGSANYDIGHVFSTGGGGVAFLGVVCSGGSKAGGVTGQPAPINDPFYIDYVAHEMGHQYGANHCFNGVNGSCAGGNRNASTAYEPGSGATIMAYAGICGADNLQSNSDPYFHHDSIREIRNYVSSGFGDTCPVATATGNNDPSVNAGANFTIPASTPFELTASGSDPDLDPITYCWEQRDLGPAQALSSPDNGSSPLFRSFDPTTNPTRTFPRLTDLINNTTAPGERLPTTNRTMNFRCTVRDNQAGGGGTAFDDMQISVNSGSGPFQVTSPNGGETWSGTATVTWNVAGTASAPVAAANVDILLSTDGGLTYPITLATGTPNDGSELIVVPNAPTSTARVKVRGSGNIFFDISNNNFTVDVPGALSIALPNGAPATVSPGQPTTIDVVVTPLAENVVPGSPALHYRLGGGGFVIVPLTPVGGTLYAVTLPAASCSDTPEFYFSAVGDLGTSVFLPSDAPSTTFTASVGTEEEVFADNFESNQGWTTSGNASAGLWERGVPVDLSRGDPSADFDGSSQCFLTENDPVDSNSDVDDGSAILTSPLFDLTDGGTVSYAYWLNDIPNGELGSGDGLFVEIATNAGSTNWQSVRSYTSAAGSWRSDSIEVGTETATSSTVRFRFTATDASPGDVVEAALDAFTIDSFVCVDVGNGDFDLDGDVDLVDFAQMQACWGASAPLGVCAAGDLNGDTTVGAGDVGNFTTLLGGPN
jgi:hypothetical protein